MNTVTNEQKGPVTPAMIHEADFAILQAIAHRYALGMKLASESKAVFTRDESDRVIELAIARVNAGAATLSLPRHIGRGPLTMLYHGLLASEMEIRREKND